MGFLVGIYRVVSPTGKIYVGQSVDIERRFKTYGKPGFKEQPKLLNSFKKYGVNQHMFEVIEECSEGELNVRERYWQDFYNVLENGLNLKLTETSDRSGKLSEETKQKLRVPKKDTQNYGKVKYWLGKEGALKGRTGELHPAFGRVGELNGMYGKRGVLSPNFGRNRPDLTERNKLIKRKSIECVESGLVFTSLTEAAEYYKVVVGTISYKLKTGKFKYI